MQNSDYADLSKGGFLKAEHGNLELGKDGKPFSLSFFM